ncbi:MAG: SHOCT domain-containing protein [Phycisphaerales bacterium]|jgi:hypothetical protein
MQGAASGDLFSRLLPWIGGLLVLAVVGGVLMLWTRRMATGSGGPIEPAGFGLDELQAMRDRGEITPEEHERARRRLVERMARRAPSRTSPPRGR